MTTATAAIHVTYHRPTGRATCEGEHMEHTQRSQSIGYNDAAAVSGRGCSGMHMQPRVLDGRLAHRALMRWLRSRLVCALVVVMKR